MKKVPTHYNQPNTVVHNPVPVQQHVVVTTQAPIQPFMPGYMPQYNPNQFFPMQPTHQHGHQHQHQHDHGHQHGHGPSVPNMHGHY